MNSSFEKKSTLIASSLGTILEWYDFTIYAYLASIISIVFFPKESRLSSLMLTYLIFAVGFLIRPIGAFIFGSLGDKHGRKTTLLATITLMTCSTFLIGIIPSYLRIGYSAAWMLLILRLLQGLSAGGEIIGATSFVIESGHRNKRFYCSIVWASSGIGILLASAIVALMKVYFSQTQLLGYGWRLPFLLSGFTGIICIYLRSNTDEAKDFSEAKSQGLTLKNPLFIAMKAHKKDILNVSAKYVICALTIYLIFVYMPQYASDIIGLNSSYSMIINTVSMSFMLMLVIAFGFIYKEMDHVNIMGLASLSFIIFSLPLYQLIQKGGIIGLLLGQLIFAVITAMYHSAITTHILESLPIRVRFTVAAIGYNLSYSLFGGTAPLLATYLIKIMHSPSAPAYYLMVGAVISLFFLFKPSVIFYKKILKPSNKKSQYFFSISLTTK